jgi:hypothetical protein
MAECALNGITEVLITMNGWYQETNPSITYAEFKKLMLKMFRFSDFMLTGPFIIENVNNLNGVFIKRMEPS